MLDDDFHRQSPGSAECRNSDRLQPVAHAAAVRTAHILETPRVEPPTAWSPTDSGGASWLRDATVIAILLEVTETAWPGRPGEQGIAVTVGVEPYEMGEFEHVISSYCPMIDVRHLKDRDSIPDLQRVRRRR